jgi:hypothetical protein
MSNFKVGEKVVCVYDSNAKGDECVQGEIKPQHGEIYTIRGFFYYGGCCGIYLKEIVNIPRQYSEGFSECCWSIDCFRKLDHAHTERICAEIIESLKVEEVQLN